MRGWVSMLRHRIRYVFDADYRADCIADELSRRIGQRVAKTINASFSD